MRRQHRWLDATGLNVDQAYPYDNGAVPFRTFTFTFKGHLGDGVRIIGRPGGTAHFTSIAELEVSYS